jgi:hypothetical protein
MNMRFSAFIDAYLTDVKSEPLTVSHSVLNSNFHLTIFQATGGYGSGGRGGNASIATLIGNLTDRKGKAYG